MLTRDRQTQKPIEIRQQEFARSLKAREMHIVSTKQYNREQDQFCHGVGVPYKLAELDHEEDRDSSGKILKSSVVYYILCMYLCIHRLCMYVCMYVFCLQLCYERCLTTINNHRFPVFTLFLPQNVRFLTLFFFVDVAYI